MAFRMSICHLLQHPKLSLKCHKIFDMKRTCILHQLPRPPGEQRKVLLRRAQRLSEPHRQADAPRGRHGRHRILLRQDGRGDEDAPHADCAQPGHRHVRDAVGLRQPQPPAGDDIPRRGEGFLHLRPRRPADQRPRLQVIRPRLREPHRLRQVRAAHVHEILQRRGDILHLRAAAAQAAGSEG